MGSVEERWTGRGRVPSCFGGALVRERRDEIVGLRLSFEMEMRLSQWLSRFRGIVLDVCRAGAKSDVWFKIRCLAW